MDVFRVTSIMLKDLGAYDGMNEICLKDFGSAAVIFGANGAGKTTLLEAISTVGHLPCIPVWDAQNATLLPSLLRRATGTQMSSGAAETWDALLAACPTYPRERAEAWLGRSSLKEYGFGGFIVSIHDDGRTVEFAVVVKNPSLGQDSDGNATLTPLLSRSPSASFLQADSDGGPRDFASGGESDTALEQGLLVLVFRHYSEFEQLNEMVLRGRTFHINGRAHSLDTNESWRKVLKTETGVRRVTYINSDLNDFGRGNDLRESPKLLSRSFDAALVERLQVPFDADGRYVYFDELKATIESVLSDFDRNAYSDVRAIRGQLELESVTQRDGSVVIRALRGGIPFTAETLSAGENEIFFLTLVVQATVRNGSGEHCMVLLDEPDLHLDSEAKERFLTALLKATSERGQCLVASHSAAAITAVRRVWRKRHLDHLAVLYKYRDFEDKNRRDLEPSPRIRSNLTYDPRPLAVISSSGAKGTLGRVHAAVRLGIEALLSSPYGGRFYRRFVNVEARLYTSILLYFVPFVYVVVSGGNDLLDFLGVWPESWNVVTRVHAQVGIVTVLLFGSIVAGLVQAALVFVERTWARRTGAEYGGQALIPKVALSLVAGVVTNVAAAYITIKGFGV